MEPYDLKAFLLFALDHYGIEVQAAQDHLVYLERGYMIEIEGNQLFKLLHGEQVIAPFVDVEAMCVFIQEDIRLNE